jgi:hypothetical protein
MTLRMRADSQHHVRLPGPEVLIQGAPVCPRYVDLLVGVRVHYGEVVSELAAAP